MPQRTTTATIAIPHPLRRGQRRLKLALVGLPDSGKSRLFDAVASSAVVQQPFADGADHYRHCRVQIGLEEAQLLDLPSIHTLHGTLANAERATLEHLLVPPIDATGKSQSEAVDAIIQVVDASALERHLELTLELSQLGRPLLLALNMMDRAAERGLHIASRQLARRLGIPVIPLVATMGQGITTLFHEAAAQVRSDSCPLPQPAARHICTQLQPLAELLRTRAAATGLQLPLPFLTMQLALGDPHYTAQLGARYPELLPQVNALREAAAAALPRPLAEELHADRHHRALSLAESVTRLGAPHPGRGWRYWLDELFLHPQGGIFGSLLVFSAVLLVVFEVSAWIDSVTAAKLIDWLAPWQPTATAGVIGRAVVDGVIGLIGIVLPYMLPLLLLLVALEQSGIMQRIAFVLDRTFHQIGLHGHVAVPFLLGLGCNVPALSAAATTTTGRARLVSAILITFVPCSARSAIILALAGKYLGAGGVIGIFLTTLLVMAMVGRLLRQRQPDTGPGELLEIPPYALPQWQALLQTTWQRSRDIITVVLPLLIVGSVLLALLNHFQTDALINQLLTPVTVWWLGLPAALGVPILFGVLRKELSLLMIYQALGTLDLMPLMSATQITTFLLFLTFYLPCVATFATLLRILTRREALLTLALSISAALFVAGMSRLLLPPLLG